MRGWIFGVALLVCVPTSALLAEEELSERDRVHMVVQQICPVSGQALGSHGKPIKVKIGDEHVFVCCRGCLKGQVKREHWATIHANFAKAQRICPVMKHELPANPKWTIVKGQIVFVCCPPCTDKIEAEPESFLTKIDDLYRASLRTASKEPARRR